jgi:hypothetical protein
MKFLVNSIVDLELGLNAVRDYAKARDSGAGGSVAPRATPKNNSGFAA